MKVLVIGGTGKVGSQVVASLRGLGVNAVSASRRARDCDIVLDMRDAHALAEVAKGFDAAFLATPLGPDESAVGIGAVAALRAAGVFKIVYLGIMNLVAMREISHFDAKIPIHDAVLDAGGVVISANFFFQNDAMLQGGVYPLPVGEAGVYSVDTGDIGHAAARAIALDDWNGTAVPLCGPDRLTGPIMAEVWTRMLGRPVVYGGNAIRPFLAVLAQTIPGWGEWEAHDFAEMMRITQEQGCPASVEDIAASAAIVGRPLRRYHDFVATLAQGNHA